MALSVASYVLPLLVQSVGWAVMFSHNLREMNPAAALAQTFQAKPDCPFCEATTAMIEALTEQPSDQLAAPNSPSLDSLVATPDYATDFIHAPRISWVWPIGYQLPSGTLAGVPSRPPG